MREPLLPCPEEREGSRGTEKEQRAVSGIHEELWCAKSQPVEAAVLVEKCDLHSHQGGSLEESSKKNTQPVIVVVHTHNHNAREAETTEQFGASLAASKAKGKQNTIHVIAFLIV